jgi:hypothetical protein
MNRSVPSSLAEGVVVQAARVTLPSKINVAAKRLGMDKALWSRTARHGLQRVADWKQITGTPERSAILAS